MPQDSQSAIKGLTTKEALQILWDEVNNTVQQQKTELKRRQRFVLIIRLANITNRC